MPFKSEAQRKLLWAKHPEIAKAWAHGKHTGKQPNKAAVKRRLKDSAAEEKKEGKKKDNPAEEKKEKK